MPPSILVFLSETRGGHKSVTYCKYIIIYIFQLNNKLEKINIKILLNNYEENSQINNIDKKKEFNAEV